MIDKETFKLGHTDAMKSRIELWAELGGDHFVAHSLWRVTALALVLDKDERMEVFRKADNVALKNLADKGIMAEVYTLRGDDGSGETDGRDRVWVYERNGEPTGIVKPNRPGSVYVKRAPAADLKSESDVE